MIPIKFKQANTEYAKSQSQYHTLPAYKGSDGIVISQWQLSIKEKFKIVFSGKLWLRQHTFNKPLQPQLPSIESPFE